MTEKFTEVIRMTEAQKSEFKQAVIDNGYYKINESSMEMINGSYGYAILTSGNSLYDNEEVKDLQFVALKCQLCKSITWSWGEGGECVSCDYCGEDDVI
jgi:hypothetical protein